MTFPRTRIINLAALCGAWILAAAAMAWAAAQTRYTPSTWRESAPRVVGPALAPGPTPELCYSPAFVDTHVLGEDAEGRTRVLVRWGSVGHGGRATTYTLQRLTARGEEWADTATIDLATTEYVDTPPPGLHHWRVRAVLHPAPEPGPEPTPEPAE